MDNVIQMEITKTNLYCTFAEKKETVVSMAPEKHATILFIYKRLINKKGNQIFLENNRWKTSANFFQHVLVVNILSKIRLKHHGLRTMTDYLEVHTLLFCV